MSLASTAMLMTGSASAANTFYDVGDLVLYFQKPGNANIVYVGLGDAATEFRGAAAGPTADRNRLNILNINTTMTDAFGANWASDTGIYAGAAGAASSSTGSQTPLGDQTRTLYVSRGRDSVGIVGLSNSTPWDLTTVANLTGPATSIIGMGNVFEVNGTAQQQILTTDIATVDTTNPFSSPGIQGLAYGAFVGGVQQQGLATSFGSFGSISSAEFLLDINRITPRLDSDTVGEVAGTRFIGSYEGTLVVGADGSVSFVTVPEPSGALALGILGTVAGLGYRRRRNA